ncbi:LDL receptor repeat-containing protein egg-1-like [Mya arenaria]|uniref:LDL receptor repeat-containing protein egg-1-like n=1 Tax=Mya arenaria TaxID=6604 RepID=UPI0022E30215|nr:LDL receptor repeat-containing protein egg-1-like [Mya arenaria]
MMRFSLLKSGDDCAAKKMMTCNDRRSCANPCNGFPDCLTAEDEKFCPPGSLCGVNRYACADGKTCIRRNQICDGMNDCPDFDDEKDCSCDGPGQYRCLGKEEKCIPVGLVCDNMEDCPDGDDENSCPPGCKCNEGQYICLRGNTCVNPEDL